MCVLGTTMKTLLLLSSPHSISLWSKAWSTFLCFYFSHVRFIYQIRTLSFPLHGVCWNLISYLGAIFRIHDAKWIAWIYKYSLLQKFQLWSWKVATALTEQLSKTVILLMILASFHTLRASLDRCRGLTPACSSAPRSCSLAPAQ